ncbi:MAG: hypothetical protein NWR96_09685 [Crocinitomicaceae bacterium]|nr:hypothetical protein [Crocinitomicaceae bacterium]MDP4761896.1 hypothetical protein [Crocinitomicaceae bacterium]
MRFFLFVQLLWFFSIPGFSQLLMNQDGEAFTDKPFFNKDIVRTNRIKSIEGNYSTKKPGEIVRETSDWFRYKFDENGQLIETLDIRSSNRKKDSVLHQYTYDSKGLVIEHRKSENEGFTTVKCTYDSLNQLESESTFREIYSYKLQKVIESNLVNVEYFQYINRTDETEQIRFNNYRLPYLDVVSHYNQDRYLIDKTTHFRVSSIEHTTKYTYNERGLLSSKAFYNEQDELADEEWKYTYDSFGNLSQVHFFRYGEFQKDFQVVFDNKTHLLGATIQREVATDFMLILRFKKYTYFH